MRGILEKREVEKPWGKDNLPWPFTSRPGQRIGEIWFEPPPELNQLLVKYIFTSEALSVQVHPSDDQTISSGLGRCGKDECWYVIDAEPGAKLAVGFNRHMTPQTITQAALSGDIEELLAWHPVHPGSFFYIPAGTVHAIGAGITLIEVQQNSDTTYRLYDYGRPRELHLEQAEEVMHCHPYDNTMKRQIPPDGSICLVQGPIFRLHRLAGPVSEHERELYKGPVLILPLAESITIDGRPINQGECSFARGITQLNVPAGGSCLVIQPCVP